MVNAQNSTKATLRAPCSFTAADVRRTAILIFVLCHAGFRRRLVHAVCRASPQDSRSWFTKRTVYVEVSLRHLRTAVRLSCRLTGLGAWLLSGRVPHAQQPCGERCHITRRNQQSASAWLEQVRDGADRGGEERDTPP